jgi:biopolymer transport protein ExbD
MKMERTTTVSDEIPTSSMADIAFLLIIYFMVTTTFTATRGLDFALPKEDDRPPIIEKEDSILVKINPGGGIEVDGKPMPLTEILDYIKGVLEKNPVKPVIIQPEPNAAYGDMVNVFDELRQSKEKKDFEIKNISIPTRREIDAFWQ